MLLLLQQQLLSMQQQHAAHPTALSFSDSTDLTSFVTRPEIKAPLFHIDVYDADNLAPGYWFVAPYGKLQQPEPYAPLYHVCQTGPHVYDQQGELVWSGACQFENLVACDFRAAEVNGTTMLSTIMLPSTVNPKGAGYILDETYTMTQRLSVPGGMSSIDMHELNLVDDGRRALYIANRARFVDMAPFMDEGASGFIVDEAIREVDLATGAETFIWWASDHIDITESSARLLDHQSTKGWDYLHMNSVVKNRDGDYLMSARYTNAIYKIASDGTVLWRLGGTRSSFTMDFDFSRQHDAQWLSYDNETELITLLDNGGDNFGYSTADISSVLTIRVDKIAGFAYLVQKIDRPDAGKSMLRGNSQNLANGNKFISWSDNAYISEHGPDGALLMQASFKSKRSVTYRAYKLPWSGRPTEKPRLHAAAYRAGATKITVYHVSWNGATEVVKWAFHRADGVRLVTVARTGFETMAQTTGAEERVYAVALDADGAAIGKTDEVDVTQHMPSVDEPTSAVADEASTTTGGEKEEL